MGPNRFDRKTRSQTGQSRAFPCLVKREQKTNGESILAEAERIVEAAFEKLEPKLEPVSPYCLAF